MTEFSRKKCQNISQLYDKITGARIPLLILKCLAIWPWKTNKASTGQLLLRFVIHVPTTLLLVFLVWLQTLTAADLQKAKNALYLALALCVTIVKLLNLIILSKQAYAFIDELQHDAIYDLLTAEEAAIWSKRQRSFRKLEIIYMFCNQFVCVLGYLGVLVSDEYRLDGPTWVPSEWRTSSRYWYAYCYNVTASFLVSLFTISVDMLVCYMIFHIGLLYKILGVRYASLEFVEETHAIQELRELFLLHSNIKRKTKECEVLISNIILALIIFSALIICFSGYRLKYMNILAELDQFFFMILFLFIVIMQIYLPCHFANQIKTNSEDLLMNIYGGCSWFKFSVANRKFLFQYMEFFKEPQELRVGKYFEIGLPLFSKVINNAYAFLTLLLNMDEK